MRLIITIIRRVFGVVRIGCDGRVEGSEQVFAWFCKLTAFATLSNRSDAGDVVVVLRDESAGFRLLRGPECGTAGPSRHANCVRDDGDGGLWGDGAGERCDDRGSSGRPDRVAFGTTYPGHTVKLAKDEFVCSNRS